MFNPFSSIFQKTRSANLVRSIIQTLRPDKVMIELDAKRIGSIGMYVCIYVCMYVCMYMYETLMYAVCVYIDVCMCIYMYAPS